MLLEEFRILSNAPDHSVKPLLLRSKFRDRRFNSDPKYRPFCLVVEENMHLRQCLAKITQSEVLWEHMDGQTLEVIDEQHEP